VDLLQPDGGGELGLRVHHIHVRFSS
jgi:hypothetical protein